MKLRQSLMLSLLLAGAACAATDGTMHSVTRKTKSGGVQCNGMDIDHLIWFTVRPANSSEGKWFVVNANTEAGKQTMAMALTALATGTPVRVDHPDAPTTCNGSYAGKVWWLEELIINP